MILGSKQRGLSVIVQEGYIDVKLYNTIVVRRFNNGDMQLNTGGWYTASTKKAMNHVLSGYRVFQRKGEWFVRDCVLKVDMPYTNGMVLKNKGLDWN